MIIKPLACMVFGLAVGAGSAQFLPPHYAHGSVMLKENGEAPPVFLKPGIGRKTLALTVKNLQDSGEVRIQVERGEIQSASPSPMVLPFTTTRWPAMEGATMTGLRLGMKIPLYIALAGDRSNYALSFVRVADGKMLLTVPVIEGEGCAAHNH